jgi:hypothetical protein
MSKKRSYKKSPIVTGYLEKVSSSIFEKQRRAITEMTRGKQGLYALYRKDKLYYVGLASNLRGRINNHLKDHHKGCWTHFSLYIIRHEEHIKEIESLLLRISWPAGNKVKGKLRRSANMLPLLKRKVRDDMLREMIELFRDDKLDHHKKPDMSAAGVKSWETRRKRAKRVMGDKIKGGKMVYARYKGKEYKAWVCSNGTIKMDGKTYSSPSAAGSAVRGGKATNGWVFWRVKDASGKMVKLSTYRK